MRSAPLGLALVAALTACSIQFETSHRSGTVRDDYVGEPLSDAVKKYEHALSVSNTAVDKLIAGDAHSLYADLCGEECRKLAQEADLVNLCTKITKDFGAPKTYKPDQWGFATKSEEGRSILCSNKLVECEKGMARIIFLFADDGRYETLLGFQVREHTSVANPGQF